VAGRGPLRPHGRRLPAESDRFPARVWRRPTGVPGRPRPAQGRGHGAAEAVAVRKWRWPPRALAVAETRSRGPTGRVGAGL